MSVFFQVMDYKFGEIENRNGQGDDVASCKKSRGVSIEAISLLANF